MFNHKSRFLSILVILTFTLNCVKSKSLETTTISGTNNEIRAETNAIDKGDNDRVPNVTCKGDPQYCNLSKEEYMEMMNNYIFPQPHEWGLIAIHSVVLVVGVVGNVLVCVAVFRNSSMRASVTYCCLVNLAVADLLVILLCLPPTVAWDVTETWFLGTAMCKIMLYFQSVSVTVSVLTLTYIAVDRYNAIVHPFEFYRNQPIVHVKAAIAGIWLVALIFNCLDLIYLTTTQQELRFDVPHMVQCEPTWSDRADLIWHVVKFVFMYTVPLLLIGGAYSLIILELWKSEKIPGQADTKHLTNEAQRISRRKVAKMLMAVVIMFAICYLPVHTMALLRYTGVLDSVNDNNTISTMALVSHVMCYVNSAINPVIYNFMSEKFRHEFRRAFHCAAGSVHEHSTTLTLTTKSKRSFEMQSLTHKPIVCELTNGYT